MYVCSAQKMNGWQGVTAGPGGVTAGPAAFFVAQRGAQIRRSSRTSAGTRVV